MKTFSFRRFLIERVELMSRDQAMRVLGLHPGYTHDDLKSAHRRATLQHHPDRAGGSNDAQAQVNLAFEALDDTASMAREKTYEVRREDRAKAHELSVAMAKVAQAATVARFNTQAFEAHFQTVFGEPFAVDVTLDNPEKIGEYASSIGLAATFANATRSIVFYLHISTNFKELIDIPRIGNPETGLTLSILTEILYNRRKVKLTQNNYHMREDAVVLSEPERLFPTAKLRAQTTKSVVNKFKKSDVLLTFQHELRATINSGSQDTWVYVPVGTYRIAMYRSTLMGMAAWMINGVYDKHSRKEMGPTVSFYEYPKSIDFLVDGLKHIQQIDGDTSPKEIAEHLTAMGAAYKEWRTANPDDDWDNKPGRRF